MCKKIVYLLIVCLVWLSVASVSQAVEPVAHWTFDEVVVEDGISIAPDVSGNGYDGILQSKVVVSANDPNDPNATMEIVIDSPADAVDPLIMDGVLVVDGNGFVEVPVEAWNDNIFDGYTVSFRILIDTVHATIPMAAKMVSPDLEARNFGCHAPWSNGNVYFDTRPTPEAGNQRYQRINTGNVSDQFVGQWSLFTFVYTPGRQELYLNGEIIKSGTGTGACQQDTTNFSIGANFDGTTGVIGMMDDVRLYDVALTNNEVRDMAGLPPVPVAHWTFDEVEVESTNDPNDPNATITMVPDVSGNGYDGILKSVVVVNANDPNDPNATMEIAIDSPANAVDPLVMDGLLVVDGNGFVEIPVEAWNDNILEGYTVSFNILIPELMSTIPMAAKMYREDDSEVRNFGCHAPWSNGNVYFDTTPIPIADGGHARYQRVNTGNISDQIIGQWVTYFFVYEPGRQEIYLDGEMIQSGTGTGDPNQDTTSFTIGAGRDGDTAIVGMMDDVRLYDVALTADEIQLAMTYLMPTPLAEWKLDEGEGALAADSTGNGFDGVVMGDATWVEGVLGTALDLDGDGDYVECPNDPALDVPNAFSIGVWINIRSVPGSWRGILTKGDDSWRMALEKSTTKVNLGWSGGAEGWPGISSTTELAFGEWYHACATFEAGDGGRMYINGVEEGYLPYADPITQGTSSVMIGNNSQNPTRYFDGILDEVRLYDTALSATEINLLMPADILPEPPVDPDPNVVTLMVFPIASLELDDPNDDDPNTLIMATAINGAGVDTLVLGTTTADPDTQERADNFDVSQDSDYSRRDSENFVTTMFDVPVSVIYILEKDGQDGGYVEVLNADGGTISDRLDFTGDDFSKTPSSQWIIGGMMVIADMPVNGIRIWSTGIDVQSVSGIPVL